MPPKITTPNGQVPDGQVPNGQTPNEQSLGGETPKLKTMACKQLGGACDWQFHAATFAEIAEQSKQHAMAMLQQQDAAHIAAMNAMQVLMQSPSAMQAWFDSKRQEFAALPFTNTNI